MEAFFQEGRGAQGGVGAEVDGQGDAEATARRATFIVASRESVQAATAARQCVEAFTNSAAASATHAVSTTNTVICAKLEAAARAAEKAAQDMCAAIDMVCAALEDANVADAAATSGSVTAATSGSATTATSGSVTAAAAEGEATSSEVSRATVSRGKKRKRKVPVSKRGAVEEPRSHASSRRGERRDVEHPSIGKVEGGVETQEKTADK